ncbi:MAG TPA: hypothetical protein VHM92_00385 [Allosphingosinicella sp.]|nr:hypothetical protein [Allosphingosinicella sp.]
MTVTWRAAAALFTMLAVAACEEQQPNTGNQLPKIAGAESARCYDREDLKQAAAMASPRLERDVLILVDQTAALPEDVRASIIEQTAALARPGTRLALGTFSSYTGSAHAQIGAETVLEPAFPDSARGDAPMQALRKLDACLETRNAGETRRIAAATQEAMASPRTDVQRSDILANVKGFAERLEGSPAPDKVLLLVSDLLENSSALSFYSRGGLRSLEPGAELEKAKHSDLLAPLAGVKVYVVGAGLPPPGETRSRSLAEVQSLERFWKDYFAASGAVSAEIGLPRLHRAIE